MTNVYASELQGDNNTGGGKAGVSSGSGYNKQMASFFQTVPFVYLLLIIRFRRSL